MKQIQRQTKFTPRIQNKVPNIEKQYSTFVKLLQLGISLLKALLLLECSGRFDRPRLGFLSGSGSSLEHRSLHRFVRPISKKVTEFDVSDCIVCLWSLHEIYIF